MTEASLNSVSKRKGIPNMTCPKPLPKLRGGVTPPNPGGPSNFCSSSIPANPTPTSALSLDHVPVISTCRVHATTGAGHRGGPQITQLPDCSACSQFCPHTGPLLHTAQHTDLIRQFLRTILQCLPMPFGSSPNSLHTEHLLRVTCHCGGSSFRNMDSLDHVYTPSRRRGTDLNPGLALRLTVSGTVTLSRCWTCPLRLASPPPIKLSSTSLTVPAALHLALLPSPL